MVQAVTFWVIVMNLMMMLWWRKSSLEMLEPRSDASGVESVHALAIGRLNLGYKPSFS